jgi:hypothetical protein
MCGEHVLQCDGSLKGLAIPRVRAKKLSCKLLSTAAAFVLYISVFEGKMVSRRDLKVEIKAHENVFFISQKNNKRDSLTR